MTKHSVRCTSYLRNHTPYDPYLLSSLFMILEGWKGGGGARWVKGQKMTHNYQFQSVTLYILGTVDHII